MLFLLSGRLPRSYPVLALIATNLVISMPAPPFKRSPENVNDARNGFSNVPKILEIQLPLKIATKDDLVAWAKYVMGLMASKINITLTTVKESPSKPTESIRGSGNIRGFDNARQPQNAKNSAFKNFDNTKPINGIRHFANAKNFENSRYAENVRNLGQLINFDRSKIPTPVRILENDRHSDNTRNSLKNGNVRLFKENVLPNPHLPIIAISGVTANNLFNNRQLQPTFGNLGISDTTIPSPLEITANINVPRSRIKDPIFKSDFDSTNALKVANQQLFVPQVPDFGPIFDVKNSDIFRNTNAITPPTRTYLPVTSTPDNINIPNDPFITRYFFDGIEKNISSNFGIVPSEITFTTHNPLMFRNKEPLPAKSVDLLSQQKNVTSIKPFFNVPFEALITFTRGESTETTTLQNEKEKYLTTPTRNPLEQFPPYFDTNYTLPNESGQINVVFDDGEQVIESMSDTRKEERKKQEKKKDSSKRQKSKKEKSDKRQPSVVGQFLKTIAAIRRNNTPAADLSPPPLNQQVPPSTQRVPVRQRIPPPQRTQLYPTNKPPSRQGRRNQTSLAQKLTDDDDSGSNENSDSKEDSGSKEGNSSEQGNRSKENSDGNESNGNGDDNDGEDVESDEGSNKNGSSESASSESDYDDSSEEEGGFIKALIDLLQLAAPILEDLSDPDSDVDIAEVLDAAIPLVQELSEGDGEGEGFDIPGLLVPVLLKISGGKDGTQVDSAAVLTPFLQLLAPLIGPLVGPLILPLSRQSTRPLGEGGSSVGDLIRGLLDPLLQPIGPGKMTPLSNLVATVVSSLSKNSGPGGKSDIMSLVKAIVAGTVAGTSAGSSGHKDSYGAPTSYGTDSYGTPPSYGYGNCQRPGAGGRC